ncbi:MAG: lipopolysaccharide biosynthesis protein [Calditrichia bacterium]
MLSNIRDTVKHSAIISLGKIGSKLVGFILLPIYTKEISVAGYGVLGLLEVAELIGVHILSIGMHQAMLRWHSLSRDESEKKSIVFSTFLFISLLSMAVLLSILPARRVIANYLFANPSYGDFLIYVLITILFTNLARIPQTLLRVEEKTVLFSVSIIVQFTMSLLLNIYFVAFRKMGVAGVLLAHAISSGALFLVLTPYLFKRMSLRLNFPIIREMVNFGYPFILTALSATVLNVGDRYILTKMASLTEVGLYSLGYKFSNILKIFLVDSFSLGLPIIGWKIVREDKLPKRFFSKTLTYFIFMLLWVGLVLSSFAKGIIHLFALNRDYWDAYLVVPFLASGVVFYGVQQFFYFILQIPKKTKFISIIITSAALVNVLLNVLLIPRYGMMAAAVVTVISHLFAALFAYFVSQKYYPGSYEIKRIGMLFLVSVALYFVTTLFDSYSLVMRILLKGSVLLLFPVVLLPLKFYEEKELQGIKYYLSKIGRGMLKVVGLT